MSLLSGLRRRRKKLPSCVRYDYAIVNDEVSLAAERVKRVIEAEHFRVDRVIGHYQDMVKNSATVR